MAIAFLSRSGNSQLLKAVQNAIKIRLSVQLPKDIGLSFKGRNKYNTDLGILLYLSSKNAKRRVK
jgi:hypothetical protein